MAETQSGRPSRLMQELPTEDLETSIGPLAAAMTAIALVLIAAGVLAVTLAF